MILLKINIEVKSLINNIQKRNSILSQIMKKKKKIHIINIIHRHSGRTAKTVSEGFKMKQLLKIVLIKIIILMKKKKKKDIEDSSQ